MMYKSITKAIVLTIILSLTYAFAYCQIWTQDFETNGLGTAYTSTTVFTANLNGHYNRTNGSNISNTIAPYTNKHGSFIWAGENINITTGGGDGLSTKTITFAPIAVTGLTNLQFRGLFGSGNPNGGWDYSDILYVEYKMDAAPWTKLMQFAANAPLSNVGLFYDANLNGIGEGAALTPALQQFVANIPVTGISLQLRVYSKCTSQGEEFAFDYLRLYSTTTAVNGCIDPVATNYDPTATNNDGSCIYTGCTNVAALNYNPLATVDNGSCVTSIPNIVINEIHYNPNDFAGFTDLIYEFVELYNNTNAPVNIGGWRISDAIDCTFPIGTTLASHAFLVVASTPAVFTGGYQVFPFTDDLSNTGETVRLYTNANLLVDQVTYYPNACWPVNADGHGPSLELINYNYDNNSPLSYCTAVASNGTPGNVNSCFTSAILGCTNATASNYNPGATSDDGSCIILGCTYPSATNYNASATRDNGSCTFPAPIPGCTNATATNYNPAATIDNGSCTYPVPISGCTYLSATNYNSSATSDDGSCIFNLTSSCPADLNGDLSIGVSDLLIFIAVFGTTCP